MNPDPALRQLLWEAYQDGCRRIEADLRQFVTPLDAWIDGLVEAGLPHDWRAQMEAYLAEQEPNGYRIEPANRWVLEQEILYRAADRLHAVARSAGNGQTNRLEARSGDAGHRPVAPATSDAPISTGVLARHQIERFDAKGREDSPFRLAAYPLPRHKRSSTTKRRASQASSNRRAVTKKSPGPRVAAEGTTPTVVTQPRLPADFRGKWISGTKGNGVFQYNNGIVNREAGIAGAKVRFKNQYIAVGGFPREAYYQGDPLKAQARIKKVTGTTTDALAADAYMRKTLRNPRWSRPKGYRWNHAGQPGSKVMELVKKKYHGAIAHKGAAANARATYRIRRSMRNGRTKAPRGRSKGSTGRVMAVLDVYMTARDALRAAGVLQPEFVVEEWAEYYFVAKDKSVFIILIPWIGSSKMVFVEGPRKDQEKAISEATVDRFRRIAEKKWGRYIPGTLTREPRFIPGTERKALPLMR